MGDSCSAGNLLELLAQIPDPRGRHGRRYSLTAMLTAIVCAILTGARGPQNLVLCQRWFDEWVARYAVNRRQEECEYKS